jgi:hypothetical protein
MKRFSLVPIFLPFFQCTIEKNEQEVHYVVAWSVSSSEEPQCPPIQSIPLSSPSSVVVFGVSCVCGYHGAHTHKITKTTTNDGSNSGARTIVPAHTGLSCQSRESRTVGH